MTVAHVVLTLDHGGLEHLVVGISERLQRRGVRSPIVVLTRGALVGEARRRGLDVVEFNKHDGFDPLVIVRLARLLRRHRVDVVHTHNLAPLVYGTLAARLCGAATVNTRHGRAPLEAHPLIWAMADRVVAVSEDARRELLAHNRIAANKVRVVLNGIDLNPYSRETHHSPLRKADFGIPDAVPVVGTVGRLSKEKDHHTLLMAFRQVSDTGSPAHLVIVGGGPLQADLGALIQRLGLGARVHLLGSRSDVPDLLPLFDAFVLSSVMEGVSLTLLEAMAAGLPVVATRVGGTPEVVADGESGILVEAGTPEALSSALLSVLADAHVRQKMGARGREIAFRKFDIGRMVDEYGAIYGEVSERRRRHVVARPVIDASQRR